MIGQVATHIEQSILCFGLRVERHQAEGNLRLA
jgi:hypothetical protein